MPAPTAYPPDAVSRRLPHTRTVPRLLLCRLTPLSPPNCLLPSLLSLPDLLPPPLVCTTATLCRHLLRCCRRHDHHICFPHNTTHTCHLLHETPSCFQGHHTCFSAYTTQTHIQHDDPEPVVTHMHASRAVGGWARETLNGIKTIKGVPFYDRFAPLFRVPLGLGP